MNWAQAMLGLNRISDNVCKLDLDLDLDFTTFSSSQFCLKHPVCEKPKFRDIFKFPKVVYLLGECMCRNNCFKAL
jgi:hypothetical protein